jgi:hypothetical protein
VKFSTSTLIYPKEDIAMTPEVEIDNRFRLYVGHKLTNANRAFLTKMSILRDGIEHELAGEFVVLKFLGLVGGTSFDVFQRDIIVNVATCDLMVAIIDEESTGLGLEIGLALSRYGKPILLIQHSSVPHVSRLVLGAAAHHVEDMVHVIVNDQSDIIKAIRDSVGWFALHARRAARAGFDPSCEQAWAFDPNHGEPPKVDPTSA